VVAVTARAAAGWIRLLAPLALVLITAESSAGPVLDPFLEQFRVGDFRAIEADDLVDGWPAELFAPTTVDSAWLTGAAEILDRTPLARDDDLRLWRLLLPALGEQAAAAVWQQKRRALLDSLRSGAEPPVALLDDPPGDPWLKDVITQAVAGHYAAGRYRAAETLLKRGLACAGALGLTAEEALVWRLRLARIAELNGRAAPSETPWPELFDLGPYDVRSGWAIWTAHRRSRSVPVIPTGAANTELARFLLRVGETDLTRAELAEAAFPAACAAGLGAAVLADSELADHFAAYPKPPEDPDFQAAWVNGQRRRQRGVTQFYEQLAGRSDLSAALRADLWRRASEIHLIRRRWDAGLHDLEAALRAGEASGTHARRLRDWCEQSLALAAADDDRERMLAIGGLVQTWFSASERRDFARTTRPWLTALGVDVVVEEASDDRDDVETLVRAGRAEKVSTDGGSDLHSWREPYLARACEIWASWGLALAKLAPSGGAAREYCERLEALDRWETGRERTTAVAAAVGHYLSGRSLCDTLLGWLLYEDVVARSGGRARPSPSPLPDIVRATAVEARRNPLLRHALLGFALVAGDTRGIVAAAVDLPGAGAVTAAEKRWFLYPLPAAESVLAAVAAAPVETPLLLAVARNESLFDPGVRSRAGALGWLQVMPFHFDDPAEVGDDGAHWSQPTYNVEVGGGLLRENLRRYGGDPYRGLAAYNAGPGAVARWVRQLGGRTEPELFLAWIGYSETRSYVLQVLIDREIYRRVLNEIRALREAERRGEEP
jgi:hypothetical protein